MMIPPEEQRQNHTNLGDLAAVIVEWVGGRCSVGDGAVAAAFASCRFRIISFEGWIVVYGSFFKITILNSLILNAGSYFGSI